MPMFGATLPDTFTSHEVDCTVLHANPSCQVCRPAIGEPLDFYLTYTSAPNRVFWLHREPRCERAKPQDMGIFYTLSEVLLVLSNRDAHACPCMIAQP